MRIEGNAIRQAIVAELAEREAPRTTIVALLSRETPELFGFVKQKERLAKELGIPFETRFLEAEDATETAIEALETLGRNKDCGGIIVELPLPARFDADEVVKHIPGKKDIDALGGNATVPPPAVRVVLRLLSLNARMIRTLHLAVVGAGRLVGEPIERYLGKQARTFTLLDKGDSLVSLENADIVVLGTGVPRLVSPDMLKRGAGVIDFGYGRDEAGRVSGDLDTRDERALRRLSFFTPTPGGTGPILVAELFENFYKLNT